jgi:hypothetical protein
MLRDISEPDINLKFTIDDIHKIREWHYDMLKYASLTERINYYNQESLKAEDERERQRQSA